MRKTLLISEILPPRTGGSGRWFWEIYGRLPPDRVVLAAGEHPEQAKFDRTHSRAIERVPLSLPTWSVVSPRGLKGYLSAVGRLTRIIRKHKIEAIHCARCLPEGLMARVLQLRTGIGYLCYVHGEEVNYATSSRELTWLVRSVFRSARGVIANSRNTVQLLQRDWGLPDTKTILLHPGVDTQQFVPAPADERVRADLKWGSRRVVLTVGRLQQRKGHDMMIRALPAIRSAIPDVLYAIVGDGDEMATLRELADQVGVTRNVRFMGEIADDKLIHCYQQCDLFALPNRQVGKDIEGFGMVLVEAQSCGKPVLAGASGGTAETMRVPETGRLVPCETPDELASVVIELLADGELRARMGQSARPWVVEHFDWTTLAGQAQAIFDRTFATPRDNAAARASEPALESALRGTTD